MKAVDEAAYRPIRDYAMIGDCHGAALVSRDGSVDWCCLDRFDADPVFCRILEANKGGFLSLQPEDSYDASREYQPSTNILRTTFTTETGKVMLTDFMPVGRAPGAGVHDYVTLNAPRWLVRIIECVEGSVRIRARYRPTVEFARRPAQLSLKDGVITSDDGVSLHSDMQFAPNGNVAEGVQELRASEQRHFILARQAIPNLNLAEAASRMLGITGAFWEEWAAYCRYQGPYREAVLRSALTLKLLTYAPTGAIVAAPTTSLPERIGGTLNWDYRYCWIRDATFNLYALATLGYSGEARRFSVFLQRACAATHPRLQIMYGIEGEADLSEKELEHLEGYRGSSPVRVGNAAYDQRQHDVYGEVLDWALLYKSLGSRIDKGLREFLASTADFAAAHWREPDQGLWEMRGPAQHHVYSKIMSWVALDRAVQLLGKRESWVSARYEVVQAVRERGMDRRAGHLHQAFDNKEFDASVLLAPLVGFPLEPQELRATIKTIQENLQRGDYLLRYIGPKGPEGEEGAFLICSFWLVDALLIAGKEKEARELFERLLRCANDVGLYAEEIDPDTGDLLGNFPQAFTHLALIQSATNLALYENHGAKALRGSHADRARYAVEAAAGIRALWAAFKKSGRVGRLWSSRASILK